MGCTNSTETHTDATKRYKIDNEENSEENEKPKMSHGEYTNIGDFGQSYDLPRRAKKAETKSQDSMSDVLHSYADELKRAGKKKARPSKSIILSTNNELPGSMSQEWGQEKVTERSDHGLNIHNLTKHEIGHMTYVISEKHTSSGESILSS